MNRKDRRRLAKHAEPKASRDFSGRFAEAYARHQAGDVAEALRLYQAILAADPGHAESLRMLGAIDLQSGRHNRAIQLLSRSVRAAPDAAQTHFLLGAAFHEAGRDIEALVAFDRALALQPDDPVGHHTRAGVLQGLGRLDEAIAGYRRALALYPDLAPALIDLGEALSEAGRREEALEAYQRAVALEPNHLHAHHRIGVLHLLAERYGRAAAALRVVIGSDPDHFQAHVDLGAALRRLEDPAAVSVLRRAVQLRPGDLEASISLANALQEQGQAAEASEVSAGLVAMHPASAYAWSIRAGLKTFVADDPDLSHMEGLLAGVAGASEDASEAEILEFALGKAWMDVGDAERAFSHLSQANRLRRTTLDYDGRAEIEGLARIPSGVRAMAQVSIGPGFPSELPVFVVGMPRSGTTLVEQILASHRDVHGAGELAVFPQEMALALEAAGLSPPKGQAGRVRVDPHSRFDPEMLGRAYVDRVAPMAGGKQRLVDKLPGNFANAGLISLALPAARIIHCLRDPVDTCLSCYAHRFVGDQPFTYDLVELGQYYRAYAALMEHWRETLPPERFLEVRYEDVLEDLEGQARRLVAFCGLDWDPACLRFHETRRPVRTASLNQVRRPLYRDSQGRSRAYRSQLRPLIEALQINTPLQG